MSAALLNVGAISGLWGIVWYAWDHKANAPGYLLALCLFGLIVGELIS
jgi:hypothetical protein